MKQKGDKREMKKAREGGYGNRMCTEDARV